MIVQTASPWSGLSKVATVQQTNLGKQQGIDEGHTIEFIQKEFNVKLVLLFLHYERHLGMSTGPTRRVGGVESVCVRGRRTNKSFQNAVDWLKNKAKQKYYDVQESWWLIDDKMANVFNPISLQQIGSKRVRSNEKFASLIQIDDGILINSI